MQDNEKKPALRFKGFTDPWEQRKLGELSRSFEYGLNAAAKEYDGQNKYLRITDIDDTSRQFVSADITSPDANLAEADNYRLSDGDVLFARTGASVGKTYLYKKSDGLVYFAGFLIRAKIKESVSAGFIFQNTLTRSYERYIAITSQRSGQPGVNAQEYAEYQLMLPELFEQEKIAKLLEALDTLITLHQRKYEKLVNIKKSMLDKMFPQNGASVPEIRFKGFTDPWEQRKLGELSRSFEYGLNAAAKEYDGQNKYLRITDIDDTSRQFVSADITSPDANLAEADNYRLSDGDVLFARTGASVGKTYLYKKSDGLVYFAGFLIRAKIKESVSAGFIFQNTLTRSYERYIAITSQRSGQPGVNAQEYAEYQLMLPELFEQEKIAKLLEALDTLITLHQRKLEKLQNIKKSCLEKMFV